MDLEEKLKKVPTDPGVYLMRNMAGQVIYVGKAKNLRNRIRQYFRSYGRTNQKVKAMVSHIEDFEYIIVRNELESLILESNLIKEYHPKYNILLRDDKQYPYIKITNEPYPRVMKTRQVIKDGAKYFGPYPNVLAVNETIQVIHEIYPIRNCKLDILKAAGKVRPCLNYFIDRCVGPCRGDVSEEEYMEMIHKITDFFEGKNTEIQDYLTEQMKLASENLNFEEAAMWRDRLELVDVLQEKQIITHAASQDEYDIINFARDEGSVCVQIFFFRQGKIMGREHFILEDPYRDSADEILRSFITQFYHGIAYIPGSILVPELLEDAELIQTWLSEKKGQKVHLEVPQRGEKRKLMNMVHKNAVDMLDKHGSQYQKQQRRRNEALEGLQDLLGLNELPRRIEGFDISNISGVESVGSMVVCENGQMKKSDYRRFRIKTVVGADDYASLREVLTRRFTRGLTEQQTGDSLTSFGFFPDLIMMDGGKGQVNVAVQVLSELGIRIPVCGLVKDDKHQTRGIIYNNEEFQLKKTSPIYKLIFQIQEEAHRFAINYHRSLRTKSTFKSELDDIPLIGPKRKQNLLAHYKSIDRIKKASPEELMEVDGMNQSAAESVYEYFRRSRS